MAKEAADDVICPMVPDMQPPVLASSVKYIRVSRMIEKDGRKRKSAIPMTDETRPNPFETTPQELLEAMQQRFSYGDFFVDLISKKGQVITGFPMFIEEEGGTDDPRDRRRSKGDGDEEEEEEEEENGEGGDGKRAPGPGGGGPMFAEPAGGAQAVPAGPVTVPGLSPERQAEWLASQNMMHAAQAKEKAAEELAAAARARSEAFTERLIDRALGGGPGAAPAGSGLAADTIRNYEDRLRNYEDRARMFQQEADRLRNDIDEMRSRQRKAIDDLEASWRDRLDRAESGLREKLTKAEKHVYDLQTDNVKLTKAKHEAEVDADAADNAKHNGGDGLNLMGLAEKVAEIAPNLPAILEAVGKMAKGGPAPAA
jgi:hypothetical protein